MAFLIIAIAVPAAAQSDIMRQVVTSAGPSSVSVTVYRNPQRGSEVSMNLQYLGGYALITEQRTVTLPAGEVDLRFEGVAGGIIPQSAIVTGLPGGVMEKNRDAALLSPSALLNGYLGRGITIRRTRGATGKTEEFNANIRTDASGGVVVETADGFEAMQCTGLNETIIYPAVPEGLSAKPTLSVRSRLSAPTRATMTLSYLATGFDWQANYVADISEDGRTMDLFSWVTLANSDETSFLGAQTQTVAGQPNKGSDDIARPTGGSIALRCWPQATTSDIMVQRFERERDEARFAGRAMPAPMMVMESAADSIMVTASKVMANQEELGDLKLYRIPVPVTVAAKSQKQVAMFERKAVPFSQIYEAGIWATDDQPSQELAVTIRFQNKKQNLMGLALPAGKLVAFKQVGGARLLLGEGGVDDKAVGEEVEITISQSPLVRYSVDQISEQGGDDRRYRDMQVTVTNTTSAVAAVELILNHYAAESLTKTSKRLILKNGKPLWRVSVPANDQRILTYRVRRQD